MKNDKILISNIQRFSLHDGPGIRTTVFLKGCTLKCPWCANPENILHKSEAYQTENGRAGVYGQWTTSDELYGEVMKDAVFYAQGGGVTYSGGEPLMQARGLLPLMEKLKKQNVHQCVETALFVDSDDLRTVLPFISLFYVDVKILQEKECSDILGGNLHTYFENIEILKKAGAEFIFRLPLIPDHTTGEKNRQAILTFLKENGPCSVELLKGHNLGAKKYRSLGREGYTVPQVSEEVVTWYEQKLREIGAEVKVCNI